MPGKRRHRFPALAALLFLSLLLAAGFLALRTADIPADELRTRHATPASRFVAVKPGLVVHLRDEGLRDGPPLILVHGSGASLHSWEPWVARLGGAHRLISLDLQGHGLTGPHPDSCYSLACMAETVEAVRRHLGLERMALAGNSMGGAVAVSYALAHPERLSALILVDAAGAPVDAEGPPPIGFRIARMPLLRDIAAHVTPRAVVARTLEASVSVKSVASEAAIDRYWELLHHPGNRKATMQRFSTPRTPFTLAGLAPLGSIPTLILCGEEESLIPVAAARWIHAALPGARLIVHSGIGHLPHEETADRSAADGADFLKAPPERPAT
ncbi:alpha/beta fold hydrolase [Sandaracinobacteroides sp. A072]|uniref:alpha/beta fold hydrolase n=1 Tax=Sandaracinobacteroides sp. A072 TaxID=3461146 RepID=UPI0040425C8E